MAKLVTFIKPDNAGQTLCDSFIFAAILEAKTKNK